VVLLSLAVAGAGVGSLLYPARAEGPSRSAAPKEDAGKEKKRLAGTWTVVAVESNGRKGTEEELKGLYYVYDAAGKWKLKKDDDTQAEGTYTIDPSKDPKTIDFQIVESISEQARGKSSLGIYEIDGDMLRVCRDWPGEGKRPTDFSAGPDSKRILAEYKRRKAE
jgi:uncharacterized protein (TIGR03067 family)